MKKGQSLNANAAPPTAEADEDVEFLRNYARIEWLQDQLTLHNGVELTYVVDGYTVDLMEHDGATCWLSVHGETLADAIDRAMERRHAIRPVHGEAKP